MAEAAERGRNVTELSVLEVGRVALRDDGWWTALGPDGLALPAVDGFVDELQANGCSIPTSRSYCYDLLRWFRFIAAVDVPWQVAGRAEVRDFVRWLRVKTNPQRRRRAVRQRPDAGSVNAVTGKRYLADGYAPRTINHALAVLVEFYDFSVFNELGPIMNPVPAGRHRSARQQRRGPTGARAAFRQRLPLYQPRAIDELLLQRLFAVMRCDRDRAMVAVTLSTGVRASELLSMTVGGVDVGRSVLLVTPKGRSSERVWVPAAPASIVWIARVMADRGPCGPEDPLWVTRRRPQRPMDYFALRMVLERANEKLGTNLTWHDLRHTFNERLLRDKSLSLVEVQHLMRHRSLSSLAPYAATRLEDLVAALHEHVSRPPMPAPTVDVLYDSDDMRTLFPGMGL